MKKLNQKAEAIFRALIAQANEEGNAKIDNSKGIYMAVCIQKTGTVSKDYLTGTVWAITHYFEQEGDLCADPEMTFLETKTAIYPLSFEMQGSILARYEVSVDIFKDQPTYKARLQKGHADFANQWMLNIKQQQGIKTGTATTKKTPLQLPAPQATGTTGTNPAEGLEFVNYSPVSFAIFGEKTKEYKDDLMKLGGKFNRFLKRNGNPEPGWIFSIKRQEAVKQHFSF